MFMTASCALQQTDERNMEYEAQLNLKREKMRHQRQHLEALQQNIVRMNHELESYSNKGIRGTVASRILRQNANYHSLPVGAKLQSLTHHIAQQNDQTAGAQHHRDTLSTHKFNMLTCKDDRTCSKIIFPNSSGNSSGGCTFSPVNSSPWNQHSMVNNGISHSENLRNTSYRMIERFALQQADVCHSKQSVAACVDNNVALSSSDQKSSEITDCFPITAVPVHASPPLTVNVPPELEPALQSKDVVCPSPGLEVDEVGSVMTDISSRLSRPSVDADGNCEPVLLPDVIGYLPHNVMLQSAVGHNNVSYNDSTGITSTVSVSAASKVPPPVARKPHFQKPCLSGYGVTSCDSVAVPTQPNVITTVPLGSVDTMVISLENTSTTNNEMPYDMNVTIEQDLLSEKAESKNALHERPLSISSDLSKKETFSDDVGQDMTDCSRVVDRPVYKPSVTCPVRRRLSAGDGSTCPSGDMHGKADTACVAEDAVWSEGSLSKVQTVKNKLQAGMSRRVQFEPLALLLDAALEGEIDLLQSTLKV